MQNGVLPQTSKLVIKCTSRQNTSVPQDPQRNSLKNTGAPLHTIISKPGTHSFTLQLPDSMHSVHQVFRVSQLEPCVLNSILSHVQSPTPSIEVDREPEYKIKEILDFKID